jgi:hypothetical protein
MKSSAVTLPPRSFRQQAHGLAHHQIADCLGASAAALAVGHDDADPALRPLDGFHRVATFAHGIFAHLGDGDLYL